MRAREELSLELLALMGGVAVIGVANSDLGSIIEVNTRTKDTHITFVSLLPQRLHDMTLRDLLPTQTHDHALGLAASA